MHMVVNTDLKHASNVLTEHFNQKSNLVAVQKSILLAVQKAKIFSNVMANKAVSIDLQVNS